MESLEDRSLMAAVAGAIDSDKLLLATHSIASQASGPAVVAKTAPAVTSQANLLTDDAYEQNDSMAAAYNLGTLSGPRTISNLVMADSSDWYKFTTTKTGGTTDSVSISLQNWRGDLDLALYNSAGQRVRYSGTTANTERVSLSGLTAGTYYVRVYGYLGATNPSYSLSVNVAAGSTTTTPPPTDDAYENNDTLGTARDLGTLSAAKTITNLVMADGNDWYRFTMNGAGASTDFVEIDFQNTQGNLNLELYNSSGTRIAYSNSLYNGERLTLANRAAGTYYVHVIGFGGATNPNYTLQIDPGTASSTGGGAFNIQFRFSGLTSAEQSIFQQAAAKWRSIITGDLPGATYGGVAVDDLLIDARGTYIDGSGSILGQAGPDAFRSSDLPYHGTMEFDSADLSSMLANGTLLGVIEHEMGHVLGIGTIWTDKGLLVGAGTSNPRFVGAQATAAYNSIFGTSATGVPVENTGGSGTRDSHWRESIFGNELMTGWVGPGSNMPISRITVGSLADLGYTVNMASADPYSASSAFSSVVASTSSPSTSTSSSTAGLASNPSAALVPLNERVLTSLLASWHVQHPSDELESSLANSSQRAHEAATDALFSNGSPLSSGLLT